MAFHVKQKSKNRTWTEILLEESEYSMRMRGAKRPRTFRRMYMSVFALLFGVFCLYTSLFYASAFYDIGQTVGLSQSSRAQSARTNILNMPPEGRRTILSPFFDIFALNRIYMRKGQTIQASYSMPKGSRLILKIKLCKSWPILEVYKCEFVSEQKKIIRHRRAGTITFRVTEPGFYYFTAEATKYAKKDMKLHRDFQVIWRRGGSSSHKTGKKTAPALR